MLAPAGDAERLDAALLYGADAVYLAGQTFGMRSACKNFTADQLADAVRKAHDQGCSVYLTCNTLPRSDELVALPGFLEQVDAAGVDALIVADIGLFPLVKRHAPHTALHVSTQFGIVNYATANALHDMGASRVVLARELSLDEIAAIRAHTSPDLELEAFVHGSMCMSISGRCMFSYYLAGRDGNRGDCSQPCRWGYQFIEPHRPDRMMTGVEEDGKTYLFNADDLNMLSYIPELIYAGVSSFKIEGRAKAAYYVAVITNAYRQAIDGCMAAGMPTSYTPPEWVLQEADKVSHRPYSTGFYFGNPTQNLAFGGYIRAYEVAAVNGYANGRLLLHQRNRFFKGDTLNVLVPGEKPFDLNVSTLYDGDGQPIDSTPHPDMPLQIPFDRALPAGSLLRRERTDDITTE